MGPFLFNLALCTLCLLGHWVFPTGCRALHPRLWVFSAHLCALYPPPARALGISYWVPRFAPSPLGIFCSSLCSVPSACSGTGYFLLGAALCTLASGYFLLISVLCTLRLLGHWVFPTGCRALHPRLWVFSAHLCALYPPPARALDISCWVLCFVPSPLGA